MRTGIRARENRHAQQLAEAETAAEAQRTRVARDMHDVVAHSLAVVIAQADGARYAAASDPQAAAEALATISTTARAALSDVRMLLTQLRHTQADGPQPTLADLEQIYAHVRAAGVDLSVDVKGAKVLAVVEIMPYSNGLTRNIVQCLEDFGIPLYLGHSVTAIHGKDRVTGITVSKVNEKLEIVPDTAFDVACDCVLLSVGLIPENELARAAGLVLDPITGGALVDQYRQTSIPGFFAAGNVLHVHDLVDFVSQEAAKAGENAARYPQLQPMARRAPLYSRTSFPSLANREIFAPEKCSSLLWWSTRTRPASMLVASE